MKITITKLFLVEPSDLSKHEITIEYFSKFLLISTDDKNWQ